MCVQTPPPRSALPSPRRAVPASPGPRGSPRVCSPPRTRAPLPQVSEDGLPSSVAEWIQEVNSSLDQMRWRVSGADHQMRNPNSIIDSLQRKYEKDVAPLLGESQKRKKPRSIPPLQAPSMSRMRTSAGMTCNDAALPALPNTRNAPRRGPSWVLDLTKLAVGQPQGAAAAAGG